MDKPNVMYILASSSLVASQRKVHFNRQNIAEYQFARLLVLEYTFTCVLLRGGYNILFGQKVKRHRKITSMHLTYLPE